ncbi:MAG: hypothetical protein LUE15_01065 [Oscillospiraceae bacterium]|nr:hypothetical protein [Oscillospiraceae bacterium]
MAKHKCPVCGQYEFPEEGSYAVCEVCGWEDDAVQEDDPDYAGGANPISLNQFRKEWSEEMSSKQRGK